MMDSVTETMPVAVEVSFPPTWTVLDPTDVGASEEVGSLVEQVADKLAVRGLGDDRPTPAALRSLVEFFYDQMREAGVVRAGVWTALANQGGGRAVLLSAWATLAIVPACLPDDYSVGDLWKTFVDQPASAESDDSDRVISCDEIVLSAGPALRVVRSEALPAVGDSPIGHQVQYLLPVARGKAVVVLTCRTSVGGDATPVEAAFTAIAQSLHSVDASPDQPIHPRI